MMGFWDLVLPGQVSAKASPSTALVPSGKKDKATTVAHAEFRGYSHSAQEHALSPADHPAQAAGFSKKKEQRRGEVVLADCFQQGYCGTCDRIPDYCPIAKRYLVLPGWTPCDGIYK
jgi:hypothetical protein